MKKEPSAIVLVSGGMDSCLCTALEIESGEKPALMHVNYGQRTQSKEYECFRKIARHYGIKKTLVVDSQAEKKIGGSSLLKGHGKVPPARFEKGEVPSTYVPFRNGIMLAYATAWAEAIGAVRVVYGAMETDSSGYPDCTARFARAFENAVTAGTKAGSEIKIVTPLIKMTKMEIVEIGTGINAPFNLTWSCYSKSDRACGKCESCVLRLKGFQMAGVKDPLRYVK